MHQEVHEKFQKVLHFGTVVGHFLPAAALLGGAHDDFKPDGTNI